MTFSPLLDYASSICTQLSTVTHRITLYLLVFNFVESGNKIFPLKMKYMVNVNKYQREVSWKYVNFRTIERQRHLCLICQNYNLHMSQKKNKKALKVIRSLPSLNLEKQLLAGLTGMRRDTAYLSTYWSDRLERTSPIRDNEKPKALGSLL